MSQHNETATHATRVPEADSTAGNVQLAEQTFSSRIDLRTDKVPHHPDLKVPGRIAITFCTTNGWEKDPAEVAKDLLKEGKFSIKKDAVHEIISPRAGIDGEPYIVIKEAARKYAISNGRYQAVVVNDFGLDDLDTQRLALTKIRTAVFLHENLSSRLDRIRYSQIVGEFESLKRSDSYLEGANLIAEKNFGRFRGQDEFAGDPKEDTIPERIICTLSEAIPNGVKGARAIRTILKNYRKEFSPEMTSSTQDDFIDFIESAEKTLRNLAQKRG